MSATAAQAHNGYALSQHRRPNSTARNTPYGRLQQYPAYQSHFADADQAYDHMNARDQPDATDAADIDAFVRNSVLHVRELYIAMINVDGCRETTSSEFKKIADCKTPPKDIEATAWLLLVSSQSALCYAVALIQP